MKKNIIRAFLSILGTYCLISAIYIFAHINFGARPEIVGMGFSSRTNFWRIFWGLPTVNSTYEGVPPMPWLIICAVKLVIAAICAYMVFKSFKIRKKRLENKI
ncbi:MAG: hypothetical protein LBL34_06315 [Clostridiales bacterium]|jgi:hypothetical protein|nr:hypothetical protein [Clostridiales bacterium]